jgi:hypothetical protein
VKTGDARVDDVLAQIEAGRVRVSDRVRTEIDELAGALDSVPDSHPDRPDTLDRLRSVVGEVTRRFDAMVDPFVEDARNERYQYEDGQGNLVTRETDPKGHMRETVSMTRTELAAKRTHDTQLKGQLEEIRDLHKDADAFVKAAVDTPGPQGDVLREKADELRAEAQRRKDELRAAGEKIKPSSEEVMRRRDTATEAVQNVLALNRSGQFDQALSAARALDRQRSYELASVAGPEDRELLDALRRESSNDMTARAAAGGQIVREGM